MELQRPNGKDGKIWLLPEIQKNISKPKHVLEVRDYITTSGHENDPDFIQWFVFFSSPPQGPWETVFSLPSESSPINVVIRQYGKIPPEKPKEPEKPKPCQPYDSMAMPFNWDIGMQLQKPTWEIASQSGLKHELVEQDQHGPDKDLNLLTAAYLSMNPKVSGSNNDFIVRDDAIYKQHTLLGNTILHLAASYGNDAMVEKVALNAPHLFTATNNNYDTALHVAARAGHGSTIKLLLNNFWHFVRRETNGHDHQSLLEKMLVVSLTLFRNKQGNTFLHEAFMSSSHNGATIFQAFEASFVTDSSEFEAEIKRIVHHLLPFSVNVEGKSLLYLAIEASCKQAVIEASCEEAVNQLMDFCIQGDLKPQGKSPFVPAIIKSNLGMMDIILSKKPNWIHLKNEEGRSPLHIAALIGYFEGVSYLTKRCASCTMERDNHGFLPIQLACKEGHVNIVHEPLKCYPEPTEMLDQDGRNLLHIASGSGKYELVRYILEYPKLEILINQKDNEGYTPLHLATAFRHPKIVYALTWDNRVDLALLNHQNLTALDIAELRQDQNPSLAQRLTWNALQSAGTPRSSVRLGTPRSSVRLRLNVSAKRENRNTEQYKDRIDTLIVVSTLIITTSFAAGFTVPGDVDQGIAVMLNHHLFHLFVLTITISVFGAISSTIILMWARLGDPRLALFALECAMPLLGLSLTTLSLAFLAGMYLVVSKLSWLATTFLVMSVVLILMVVLLYSLLLLPFSTTLPFFRYISYYPFLFLAKIAEGRTDANHQGSTSIIRVY